MDPLEDVLRLVNARAEHASTVVGHGEWALRFPPPAGAKFNAVLAGSCTVDTAGLEHPVTLRAGDSFLLTRPQEFTLATSPTTTVQAASPFFRATAGRRVTVGPAAEPVTARLVGGSFVFDRRARDLLLDVLPPLIHLPAHAEGASMVPHLLNRIDREAVGDGIGSHVVTEHLAVVLLVDLIRYHLAHHGEGACWLHGLSDPVVAAALQAIHADPARRWTVQLLAATAHVSRSTLAARFKRAVGQGPLEYLTRWRVELGAHRLAATEQTVATIADAVGYGSEAAFSLAFKREIGTPPGSYRRKARAHDPSETLAPVS